MEKYLDLVDGSVLEGTTEEELEEVLTNIDRDREYRVITPDQLRFLVLDEATPNDYCGVVIPASTTTCAYRTFDRLPIPEDLFAIMSAELRKEGIGVGVYFIDPDKHILPVSIEAINDMQVRLGLNGKGTDYKSPMLMELLCDLAKNQYVKVYEDPETGRLKAEKNGNSQKEAYSKRFRTAPNKVFNMTVVMLKDHENDSIKKVFSFRSGKYVPIEQKNILEVLHRMKMMGNPSLHSWRVSHFITEADVCFEEVAEEFSQRLGVPEKVIPCFRINTSDTGRSSLRIAKYLILERTGEETTEIALRLPECEQEKKYELTRHFGKTDIDDLVGKINANLFATFKTVPEKIGKISFMGDAPTKDALRIAFKAMKLQKHAGVIISQDLEEKIVEDLASKLPPVQRLFDTVYAVLFAASNEDLDLSENQREELRTSALLAVFPTEDYEKIIIKTAVPAAV